MNASRYGKNSMFGLAAAVMVAAGFGGQLMGRFANASASVAEESASHLNLREVARENALAEQMLEEQALQPTILPDGTKVFTLTAQPVTWTPYPGKTLTMWGYNGQVPGPLLRLHVGDRVEVIVHNHLPETTTVHWHGLSVPNAMDGVPNAPEPPIPPGGTFVYKFVVTSEMEGTHWYHSHYDDDTQVEAGLYGPIIVESAQPAIPNSMDRLLVLGATKVDGLDAENAFFFNGRSYPYTPTLVVHRGQTVRLRLVNACAESYHAITLDGNDLTLLAEDGNPLSSPQTVSVVSLAPSETVDVAFTPRQPGKFLLYDTVASSLTNPDDNQHGLGGMVAQVEVR